MITTWIGIRIFEITQHRLELGNLHINAGSQHMYDINREQVKTVLLQGGDAWCYNPLDIIAFDTPTHLIKHLYALRDRDWSVVGSKFLSELKNHVRET
jgi:hypothetical protein